MASSDSTEQLIVELNAKIDQFQANFDKASKTADDRWSEIEKRGDEAANRVASSFGEAAQGISDDIESINTKTAAIIAAIAGATVVTLSQLYGLTNSLSKIGDRADDLRLPVNMLQALSIAADQARVKQSELNSALDSFTEVSKKSKDDAEAFYKALRNIGSQFVKAFQNAPTQAERLRVVSDALKSTTDEVKKAQLAQQAFGTDSERLTAVLGAGRDGIGEYIDQMRSLGLAIDETAVRKAQQARSEISLFARVLGDEFSSSLAGLIPIFTRLLPYVEKLGALARDIISIYAPDNLVPIESLKDQVATIETQIAKLKSAREALENGNAHNSVRDALRKFFGVYETPKDEIKDIDDQISKAQAQITRLKALIAEKEKLASNAGNAGGAGAEKPAFKPRESLTSTDDTTAFERQINVINRHIAALNADAVAVGLTKSAHDKLRAELSLLQAVERDGAKITAEQIDKYAQLRTTMSAQEALSAAGITLNREQAKSFVEVTTRIGEVSAHADELAQKFKGMNAAIQFSGNEAIGVLDGLREGTLSVSSALGQLANAFIHATEQAALLGTGPLAQLFGTASPVSGGTGGLLGGLLGLLGGKRAEGGPVTAGKAYIVGEKRPEVFVPTENGIILPDTKALSAPTPAPSGMIGGAVTQTNTFNVTVNGSAGTPKQNKDLADKITKQMQGVAASIVTKEISRQMRPGGLIASGRR